jgi:hypothetical protein
MKRYIVLIAVAGAAALVIAATRNRVPPAALPGVVAECIEGDHRIDLGRVETGLLVECPFQLRNPTATPIQLSKFRTGCGCFAVYTDGSAGRRRVEDEATVPAGGTLTLIAALNTRGMTGRVSQSAYYVARSTEGVENPGSLTVSVLLEPPLRCEPEHLDLGPLSPGEPKDFTIRLLDMRDQPQMSPPLSATSNPSVVVVGIEPVAEAPRTYLIRGRLTVPHGEREVAAQIVLRAESGRELCRASIRATSRQRIHFTPARLVFPSPDPTTPYKTQLCMTTERPCTLRVIDSPEGMRVSIAGDKVTVELPGPPHNLNGMIRLTADFEDGYTETLQVPVSVFADS